MEELIVLILSVRTTHVFMEQFAVLIPINATALIRMTFGVEIPAKFLIVFLLANMESALYPPYFATALLVGMEVIAVIPYSLRPPPPIRLLRQPQVIMNGCLLDWEKWIIRVLVGIRS